MTWLVSPISAVWVVVIFFVVNLLAMIATVVVNSFATRWFGTWLPAGFTTRWYVSAWNEFQLSDVLVVTFQVAGAVAALSAVLGVPAAYALARRDFPGKRFVLLLFLLPLLVPPFTFGIPLATVLDQFGAGGTIWGVIIANLVPTVPFVILVMIPFVEQIDPRIEAAARVFGAGTGRLFVHVLVPLLARAIREEKRARSAVTILVDHGWLVSVPPGVVDGTYRRQMWRIVMAATVTKFDPRAFLANEKREGTPVQN